MSLPAEQRDALFKSFGRAFFKRDTDALYACCSPDFTWMTLDQDGNAKAITGKAAVGEQLNKRSDELENIRFEDVHYHHAPDATFMTFRLTATRKDNGAPHEEIGIERYTFKDGLIALKDVYRKPA
jgi:ketosteroid isomerase-like protein